MSPEQIIRRASLAGIDLNIRQGQLYALPSGAPPPADVLAAIREHKAAIIVALTWWPGIASLRTAILDRCRPLTPDDLTAAERIEAETLAANLQVNGGLGQFVCDLLHTWNDLSERDRLAAATVWQLAATAQTERIAA